MPRYAPTSLAAMGASVAGAGLASVTSATTGGGAPAATTAAGAEVVVLPALDDAVDGGGHDASTLLDGLRERERVEGLLAVTAVGVGVALGGAGVGG